MKVKVIQTGINGYSSVVIIIQSKLKEISLWLNDQMHAIVSLFSLQNHPK